MKAFSLLLCASESSEVRPFLRKGRLRSGRIVYTRSENAGSSRGSIKR
jgi:hypothetical protein